MSGSKALGACLPLVCLLFGAGCDKSTDGALGRVQFTPEHCGIPFGIGCSFDRHLTSGATVEIYVEGKDGFSSAGLDLESRTPTNLSLEVIPDLDGRPAWRLLGEAPGRAEIAVVDRDGLEVDFLRFDVRAPRYRVFQSDGGTATRDSSTAMGFDASWRVATNVDIVVRPYDDSGDQMMGILELQAELSSGWSEVDLRGEIERGEIEYYNHNFSTPLEATFTDPKGVQFRLQLHR